MGRGSRLVRCPQSEIVDEVRMKTLGRKRVNIELQGPGVSGFPLAFLASFFVNLNQRASIDMKHVRRSDLLLPSEGSSPYSIGKVDSVFCKSIASASDSLGKYSPI